MALQILLDTAFSFIKLKMCPQDDIALHIYTIVVFPKPAAATAINAHCCCVILYATATRV